MNTLTSVLNFWSLDSATKAVLEDDGFSYYDSISDTKTLSVDFNFSGYGDISIDISFKTAFSKHYRPFPTQSKFQTCDFGYFQNGTVCQKWLTCNELSDYNEQFQNAKQKVRGRGARKIVFTKIENIPVAAAFVQDDEKILPLENAKEIFTNALVNLLALQPYNFVIPIIGFCVSEDFTTMLTLKSSQGDMSSYLKSKTYRNQSVKDRFEFILSLLDVIKFQQLSPIGTGIICDSVDYSKFT